MYAIHISSLQRSYIYEKNYIICCLEYFSFFIALEMLLIVDSKYLILCSEPSFYEFKQMCDYSISSSMLCTIQSKVQL